jgi:hypothetical protein
MGNAPGTRDSGKKTQNCTFCPEYSCGKLEQARNQIKKK